MNNNMLSNPVEKYILYADDDTDDQQLMQEMITDIDPSLGVKTFENGMHVLEFLHELPKNALLPCFIILDINMPQWDGIRTLKALKEDDRYKNIPIVMFSTSNEKKEVDASLQLGAQAYITKPVHANDLGKVTARFSTYCQELPAQTKP